ncbi:MAG: DUF1549 domain-containing protein, partial [Verrucomicrobiota bacterium]
MKKTLALLAWVSLASISSADEFSSEGLAFFESKIRPVLIDSCYRCHSAEAEKVRGGLLLDTRAGLLAGGDTGPALVPGDADASLLWTSVTYEEADYEMPPKDKLPEEVIADFRTWIEMGAPDPRDGATLVLSTEIDLDEGRKFWSFQPPVTNLPADGLVRDGVDRLVTEKAMEEAVSPVGRADELTLLRRLFFDLVGMPPSAEQVKTFAAHWKEDEEAAWERVIDELIASPHYGERWGRHWLDVARYAESTGKEVNLAFPQAWRFRDYVIDSFNQDKPYDRFLLEQLAGDLLPIRSEADWQENLIATGYLAMGTKGLNERNRRQFRMELVDEQIDTVTQSMLGLTVACARCHDHKSDPIPTDDYYALAGIFLSTDTYFGTSAAIQNANQSDLLLLPIPDEQSIGGRSADEAQLIRENLATQEAELANLGQQARQLRTQGRNAELSALQPRILRLRSLVGRLQSQVNATDEHGRPKTMAMGVQASKTLVNSPILVRGEIDKAAQIVPRGLVQVLQPVGATPVV